MDSVICSTSLNNTTATTPPELHVGLVVCSPPQLRPPDNYRLLKPCQGYMTQWRNTSAADLHASLAHDPAEDKARTPRTWDGLQRVMFQYGGKTEGIWHPSPRVWLTRIGSALSRMHTDAQLIRPADPLQREVTRGPPRNPQCSLNGFFACSRLAPA